MGAKKDVVQTESLDIGAAQKAFEQLLEELEQLDATTLQPVRTELQRTAAIAYSVAMRDKAAERRGKLALVAQGSVFELSVLDRLPLIALAAFHVRRKQVEALDTSSTARLPESSLKVAQVTRGRMMRVLSYYFEEHQVYGKRITAIRAGTGHLDLANDLLAVADLYELSDVKAVVSLDPAYYRADDPSRARQLAQELFRSLGLTPESDGARWTDLAQRAWTLLSQNYDALRAAGQLVFRNEEDVEVTYPSLVSATRAQATRATAPSNPVAPVLQVDPAKAQS